MDVVAERLGPVLQRRLHGGGAGRGERDVPAVVAERADDAVVDHEPVLAQQHRVAEAAGLEIAHTARVEPLEERRRVRAGDEELAERADVHHADALAHRPVLGQRVAIVLGPAPGPGRFHGRVEGEVALVQRGVLMHLVAHARRGLHQRDPARGRAGGHGTVRRAGRAGAGGDEGAHVAVAHRALARPHGRGRVALDDLGGAKALLPGLVELVHADVLAQADDAVARCARQLRLGTLRLWLPAPGPAALLPRPRRARGRASPRRRRATTGSPAAWSTSPSRATSPRARTSASQSISSRADPLSITTRSSSLPPRASHDPSVHERDVGACGPQRAGVPLGLTRAARHDDPPAGQDAMHAGQPRRAAREPDAGQIVTREHAVLVDGARGDDHRLRVCQVEQVRAR